MTSLLLGEGASFLHPMLLCKRREAHLASADHMCVSLVQVAEMYDLLPHFCSECSVFYVLVKQLVAIKWKKRNKLEFVSGFLMWQTNRSSELATQSQTGTMR